MLNFTREILRHLPLSKRDAVSKQMVDDRPTGDSIADRETAIKRNEKLDLRTMVEHRLRKCHNPMFEIIGMLSRNPM
jgi:hypothetical protein